MNAKRRNNNRQTAEALHYAIQRTNGKQHYRLKPFHGKRNKQSGYTLLELLIVIFGVGALALACFLVYALVHFVTKLW